MSESSLTNIIAEYATAPMAAESLRQRLHSSSALPDLVNPALVNTAIEALAKCLEAMRTDSTLSPAQIATVVKQFLLAWEMLAEAVPTAVDAEIPRKVLANAPESVREDNRLAGLLKQIEKTLGRSPSPMTTTAVISVLGSAVAARMLKTERNEDVLAGLIAARGDEVDARTVVQVFKRMDATGFGQGLTEAFAKLKHRTIGELLPLDSRGTLGQALSRGLLAGIIKPAPAKTVASILRNSGSRKAIECCLEERIFATDAEPEHVGKWLHAFFEGLAKFSASDSEAMCSRLVLSTLPSDTVLDPLRGVAAGSPWLDHGKKALVNAALRALAVPELRLRVISLLVRAADLSWLDEEATRQFREALAVQPIGSAEDVDDSALRWRLCDRVIACLERAAEQNYDRVALEALLMGTLGEFGLRTGAYAGETSSFDGDVHETTLWSCLQGEPVLLQTDVLRLDDPVAGDIVRRGKVIPVARASEAQATIPTQ